jgi:hypothetical protein
LWPVGGKPGGTAKEVDFYFWLSAFRAPASMSVMA